MNPFKIADELIKRDHKVPIRTSTPFNGATDDWEPYSAKDGFISLRELLTAIKDLYEMALAQRNYFKERSGVVFEVRNTSVWGDNTTGSSSTTIKARFSTLRDAESFVEEWKKKYNGSPYIARCEVELEYDRKTD